MGACFYFLLAVGNGWVAHVCQPWERYSIQGLTAKNGSACHTPDMQLLNQSWNHQPLDQHGCSNMHRHFLSVTMNTRSTSVDRMMRVFLDLLPCTINLSFKSKNLFNHVHLSISSIGVQLFCVTLNELLSIISHTFSCRIGTISADTNRWVSSKSSITNFLPKVIFSSRWRRNCFTAGSLQEKRYFIY